MIRASLLALAIFGFSAGIRAGGANGPDIIGNWTRQDGETLIRISPCGDAICAVNTWVRDPNGDEKLGDTLMMTMKPKSPTALSGRAYDKRRDRTYSMSISVGPSGMRTSGCVLLGILCKSAEWRRIP